MATKPAKPFHESILDAIKRAEDGPFSEIILGALLKLALETKIPANHLKIRKAFEYFDGNDQVLQALSEKLAAEEKEAREKKGKLSDQDIFLLGIQVSERKREGGYNDESVGKRMGAMVTALMIRDNISLPDALQKASALDKQYFGKWLKEEISEVGGERVFKLDEDF